LERAVEAPGRRAQAPPQRERLLDVRPCGGCGGGAAAWRAPNAAGEAALQPSFPKQSQAALPPKIDAFVLTSHWDFVRPNLPYRFRIIDRALKYENIDSLL